MKKIETLKGTGEPPMVLAQSTDMEIWKMAGIMGPCMRLIPLNQVRLYVVGATLLRGLSRLMMSQ
jgi:hypothetical protein